MSKVLVTKEKLDAIGDAIRAKTGTTDLLTLDDMKTAIENQGGGYDASFIERAINGTLTENDKLPDDITEIADNAFWYCTKLRLTSLPKNLTVIGTQAFYECRNLNISKIPNGVTRISDNAFYRCSTIKELDMPSVTYIGNTAIYCSGLERLILRSSTVCRYSTSNMNYDPQNAKIYVPRALVDSYKTATNWRRMADKFLPLEDYTVDGTTTGEMNLDADGNIIPNNLT